MKKYVPAFICFLFSLVFFFASISSSPARHINTYPNLPAPIGQEKILITSAGQAAEATVLKTIAESLNLESDFRPRALASDLYDYKTIVIVLGYSANGLAHTPRSFHEELARTKNMAQEAESMNLPMILINLSGENRHHGETFQLFEEIVAYADYYIGIKSNKHTDYLFNKLESHQVPATLVHELDDIAIPFNSAFR